MTRVCVFSEFSRFLQNSKNQKSQTYCKSIFWSIAIITQIILARKIAFLFFLDKTSGSFQKICYQTTNIAPVSIEVSSHRKHCLTKSIFLKIYSIPIYKFTLLLASLDKISQNPHIEIPMILKNHVRVTLL